MIHDEVELPFGEVRLKEGPGSGRPQRPAQPRAVPGQSRDFWRVRVGVGRPDLARQAARSTTCSRLSASPARRCWLLIGRAADLAEEWLGRRGGAASDAPPDRLPARLRAVRPRSAASALPAASTAARPPAVRASTDAASGGAVGCAARTFVHPFVTAGLLARRPWRDAPRAGRRRQPGGGGGAGARAGPLLPGPAGALSAAARGVVRVGGRGEAAGGRPPRPGGRRSATALRRRAGTPVVVVEATTLMEGVRARRRGRR